MSRRMRQKRRASRTKPSEMQHLMLNKGSHPRNKELRKIKKNRNKNKKLSIFIHNASFLLVKKCPDVYNKLVRLA